MAVKSRVTKKKSGIIQQIIDIEMPLVTAGPHFRAGRFKELKYLQIDALERLLRLRKK